MAQSSRTARQRRTVLEGIAASPGTASGQSRVLSSSGSLDACQYGEIVIARHATPSLYPALVKASAIVAETGGMTCHLAILARELNKPCVTGVAGVVSRLRDGVNIIVDGYRGTVELPRILTKSITPSQQARGPQPTSELIPVLNIGRFSETWNRLSHSLTLDGAVQVAAFAQSPVVVGLPPLTYLKIENGTAYVRRTSLEKYAREVVKQIAERKVDFTSLVAKLHQLTIVAQDTKAQPDLLLASYFASCRLVWMAAVASEQMFSRYIKQARKDMRLTSDRAIEIASAAVAQPSFLARQGSSSLCCSSVGRSRTRNEEARALLQANVGEEAYPMLHWMILNVRCAIEIREEKRLSLSVLANRLVEERAFELLPGIAPDWDREEMNVLRLGSSMSRHTDSIIPS